MKVMVFIDGSWLYYSFHGRRPNCPVTSAYGRGWEYGHSFDYDRLPQLISHYVHDELLRRHRSSRFVEIVRTVVFSSARADTHHRSTRMRMFRQMEEANFEVHMAVTTGIHEKCIDISLAVEMMHYASVPDAYDVAVLVSGDKDFMPALARIRQKGKRVALCSMRNCCARDLLDPRANVRDFDPIWLDDHLDYLIVPNDNALAEPAGRQASAELLRIVTAYLRSQAHCVASSRDLGRALQGTMMAGIDAPGIDALSMLKQRHAGLRAFIETFPENFQVELPEEDDEVSDSFTFFVRLLSPEDGDDFTNDEILMDAKIGSGVVEGAHDGADLDDELDELDNLDEDYADEDDDTDDDGGESRSGGPRQAQTVAELRTELLRRGLPTSGRKAELIERLIDAESRDVVRGAGGSVQRRSRPDYALPRGPSSGRYGQGAGAATPVVPTYRNGLAEAGTKRWASKAPYGRGDKGSQVARGASTQQGRGPADELDDEEADELLVSSVVQFLEREGGTASSRNVGRHLAAANLLQRMKRSYAGLYHFLQKHDDRFTLVLPTGRGELEYQVHLANAPRAAAPTEPEQAEGTGSSL